MDLPDAENRMKILRIFLASENIEPGFQFDKLANATEGYSGSDLKVLHWLFIFIPNLCCCVSHVYLFCRTSALLLHTGLSKNFWRKNRRYMPSHLDHVLFEISFFDPILYISDGCVILYFTY